MRHATALFLLTSGVFAAPAQTTHTATTPNAPTVYRLTFVLSQGTANPRSFVLDVPMQAGHNGFSSLAETTGLDGVDALTVHRTLQCSDVHPSAAGLSLRVSLTEDSVGSTPVASGEPVHQQFNFERAVELPLNQPTRITEEMRYRRLEQGKEIPAPAPHPSPEIKVTATPL